MADIDIITQMEETARRRRLLDALSKSSQEAPLVGKQGGTQAVMQVLSGLINNYSQGKLSEEEARNRAKYNTQLGQETNSYLDRMSGKPGQVLNDQQAGALMNNNQDPGPLAEPVQRNPREAVTRALTSNLPEMQRLGQAGMAGLGKSEDEKFGHTPTTMQGPDGKMMSVLIGDRGTVKPVAGFSPAIKLESTAGGRLYDPYKGEKAGYIGDKFGPTQDVNGEAVQFEEDSGKAHQVANRPPQVRVNNSPTFAGQKAGFEEWSKSAAKTVGELAEIGRNANKILGQANQLEALTKSGVANGTFAPAAVFLGQLATSVGLPMTKDQHAKLQNSETFGLTAMEMWLSTMNANGGSRGIVKEESQKIADNLPALIQTPEGRMQMLAVLRQKAQQDIADAKTAQAEYGKALQTQDPGAFTYGLSSTQLPNTVPTQAAPGSVAQPGKTPGGVRSWRDYLGAQ